MNEMRTIANSERRPPLAVGAGPCCRAPHTAGAARPGTRPGATRPMTNARIERPRSCAPRAVAGRDGSQVSTVVIVPAFHSAPATDAPQIAAPSARNTAASVSMPSPLPAIHQFDHERRMIARRLCELDRIVTRRNATTPVNAQPAARDERPSTTPAGGAARAASRRASGARSLMPPPPRVDACDRHLEEQLLEVTSSSARSSVT